jgi:hypothetical protein
VDDINVQAAPIEMPEPPRGRAVRRIIALMLIIRILDEKLSIVLGPAAAVSARTRKGELGFRG